MKKLAVFSFVLILTFTVGVGLTAASGPHWTYEGEVGPEHWGELSEEFAACGEGMEQSPIDVPASAPVNAADIVFNYQPVDLKIKNNGHTVKVDYAGGNSSMEIDGKTYHLAQFHFHALSEHTLGGNHSDGEMHLVHQSPDGEYTVVGVMLERGAENAAFALVWDNMPAEEGEPETVSGVTVNAADLLPADQSYYRYNGSFTTPPCTEGVNWFVMSNPVELSDAQMVAFEVIYDYNYRPVQPLNARTFLETSPQTLPESGGFAFPIAGVLLGLGGLMTVAGLYLRRR
ncbi:carbonic anhydrase [Chloroflexota bacterium]